MHFEAFPARLGRTKTGQALPVARGRGAAGLGGIERALPQE